MPDALLIAPTPHTMRAHTLATIIITIASECNFAFWLSSHTHWFNSFRRHRQIADICRSDKTWLFPTISFTGQRSPEWFIFSIGLNIAGALMMWTVHLVHRRFWAAACFNNVDPDLPGKLITDPRVFCVPCCVCTDKDEYGEFCPLCLCSRDTRPSLKCMMKTSEIAGMVSGFFLMWVGWARMTYSASLHNYTAYTFFAAGILYLPMITLVQHQIRKKCPAYFLHPWRYFIKVMSICCLIIIGLTYLFVFAEIFASCKYKGENEWKTAKAYRLGFPIGEWIAALFIGIFIFTHVEDIRIDRWTSDRSLETPNQKIGRKSMAVRVIRDKPVEDNATVTPNQAFSGPHVSQPTADYVTTFNLPPTENEL